MGAGLRRDLQRRTLASLQQGRTNCGRKRNEDLLADHRPYTIQLPDHYAGGSDARLRAFSDNQWLAGARTTECVRYYRRFTVSDLRQCNEFQARHQRSGWLSAVGRCWHGGKRRPLLVRSTRFCRETKSTSEPRLSVQIPQMEGPEGAVRVWRVRPIPAYVYGPLPGCVLPRSNATSLFVEVDFRSRCERPNTGRRCWLPSRFLPYERVHLRQASRSLSCQPMHGHHRSFLCGSSGSRQPAIVFQ